MKEPLTRRLWYPETKELDLDSKLVLMYETKEREPSREMMQLGFLNKMNRLIRAVAQGTDNLQNELDIQMSPVPEMEWLLRMEGPEGIAEAASESESLQLISPLEMMGLWKGKELEEARIVYKDQTLQELMEMWGNALLVR